MSQTKSKNGIWAFVIKMFSKILSILAKGAKFWLAAASAVSYTYLFGWRFALSIMVLLFVHESGHVWAMRKSGIPTKGFYFIPFVGGAAVPDREFKSRVEEFYVAIMGPIWGFLLSLFVLIIYLITQQPIFAVIASWMALINLFNLLPINPLDGGRMLKSILFSVNSKIGIISMYIGIALFALFLFLSKIYLFGLLLIVAGIELYLESNRNEELPKIPKNKIWLYSLSFILIGVLLYLVIYFMRNVPGSDIANKIMKG